MAAAAPRTIDAAPQVAARHLEHIFNIHASTPDPPNRSADMERILQQVREHAPRSADIADLMQNLSAAHMFSEKNIRRAILKTKKGTVPAADGYDTAFYAHPDVIDIVVPILAKPFQHIAREDSTGMTEAMRMATISVLYKGRGKDRTKPNRGRRRGDRLDT